MSLDPSDITPSLAQVGALIRTRTKRRMGGELGTFDDTTRPTAAEVGPLIDRATRYVSLAIGDGGDDDESTAMIAAAKDVVASFAALYIEQSYYADSESGETSTADQLGRIAREQLAALTRDAGRGRVIGSVEFVDQIEPPRPASVLAQIADGEE